MNSILERLTTAVADRYAIERELGAGGMATVYLAHDLRHDRPVAVKVLRPELVAVIGADRFLAEIKTTANLQHPHILPLHDSGETDGFLFYVMPYVEGESLRERLTREKQLPVEEAVRIATEVADALDYAHRHHVIHRDIKPENVLLHDGRALVADFGIALAVSTAGGGTRMTETGMSLGTPHYMSPEQAMGEREITAKSDVYALGVVLYEMLVGEPPFTGPTAQAIVARVVTEEPRSLTLQRKTVPPYVEAAVRKALAKLPADRFATAAQFAAALAGHSLAIPAAAPIGRRVPRIPLGAVGMLGAAVAGAVLGVALWPRGDASGPPARFSVTMPGDLRLTNADLVLSPDGHTIVFSAEGNDGTTRLYARRLDELAVTPLAGTEGGCCANFSPDGRWIAFSTGAQMMKVASEGGAAVAIPVRGDTALVYAEWSGPNRFLALKASGEVATLDEDGTLRVFAAPDSTKGEATLVLQDALPDGSALVIAMTQPPNGPLVAIDPATGRRSIIIESVVAWAGYGDGHLVWALPDGSLYAAPFDAGRKRLTGPTQALGATAQVTLGQRPIVAVSRNNTIAYVPSLPLSLTRVDRDGRSTTLLDAPRPYHSPRVSPDGRRVAVDFREQTRDVWLFDLADQTLSRLTFDNDGHDPTWMPDGRGVLYATSRNGQIGTFRRNADGGGVAESVLVQGLQLTVHSVTPDGRTGIGVAFGGRGGSDLFTVLLTGGGKAEPLLATPFLEGWPALSPDGRWLAYQSNESGRDEVYVRPFPGPGGKIIVSQNGGAEPVWARGGRELFYRSFAGQPQLVAAAVETGSVFRVVSRTPLFEVADYEPADPHANYDVFPDGRSFLMVRRGRLSEIVYLQNLAGLLQQQATRR